jgi:hypothetical protein
MDESNSYFHPSWMKVTYTFIQGWKLFSPKNSAPIRKVGEEAGVLAVIIT